MAKGLGGHGGPLEHFEISPNLLVLSGCSCYLLCSGVSWLYQNPFVGKPKVDPKTLDPKP